MNLFRILIHGLYRLGNHLLASKCLLCGCSLNGDLLCPGCLGDLPWLEHLPYSCRQCALALASPADLCGHCLKQPPAFSQSLIPFTYDYPLTPLIYRFKYRRKLAYGKLLGKLLTRHIADCAITRKDWRRPDLLIPSPMHWTRRWQRGFNQAEILSQYLSQTLGIASHSKLVEHRQRTQVQKTLTRRERQKNLRNAFYLSPKAKTQIQGKRIALVDDVVTTTATMRELSRLLIKAGAKEVQVWALARTMNRR